MVCDTCQVKLSKLAVPDKWKASGSMINSRGNTIAGHTNKALSAMKASSSWMPSDTKCKLCKSKVQNQMNYCNNCSFKRGICAMCGIKAVDVSMYKSSNLSLHKVEHVVDEKNSNTSNDNRSSSSSSSSSSNNIKTESKVDNQSNSSSNLSVETGSKINQPTGTCTESASGGASIDAVPLINFTTDLTRDIIPTSALWGSTGTVTTAENAIVKVHANVEAVKILLKPIVTKTANGIGLDINVNKHQDGTPSGGAIVMKLKDMPAGHLNPSSVCDPPIVPGDVIVGVNGRPLLCYVDILAALRSCAVGSQIELSIERF